MASPTSLTTRAVVLTSAMTPSVESASMEPHTLPPKTRINSPRTVVPGRDVKAPFLSAPADWTSYLQESLAGTGQQALRFASRAQQLWQQQFPSNETLTDDMVGQVASGHTDEFALSKLMRASAARQKRIARAVNDTHVSRLIDAVFAGQASAGVFLAAVFKERGHDAKLWNHMVLSFGQGLESQSDLLSLDSSQQKVLGDTLADLVLIAPLGRDVFQGRRVLTLLLGLTEFCPESFGGLKRALTLRPLMFDQSHFEQVTAVIGRHSVDRKWKSVWRRLAKVNPERINQYLLRNPKAVDELFESAKRSLKTGDADLRMVTLSFQKTRDPNVLYRYLPDLIALTLEALSVGQDSHRKTSPHLAVLAHLAAESYGNADDRKASYHALEVALILTASQYGAKAPQVQTIEKQLHRAAKWYDLKPFTPDINRLAEDGLAIFSARANSDPSFTGFSLLGSLSPSLLIKETVFFSLVRQAFVALQNFGPTSYESAQRNQNVVDFMVGQPAMIAHFKDILENLSDGSLEEGHSDLPLAIIQFVRQIVSHSPQA